MAHEHGKMQITKQSGGFPWPPVVVVIALLILAAILWLMRRPSQMPAAQPQEARRTECKGRSEIPQLPAARGVDAKGTAPFRITFTRIPGTWNKDKPELTVTQIQTLAQTDKPQKSKY